MIEFIGLRAKTYAEVDTEGGAGGGERRPLPFPLPIFCSHLFFLNHFEELQTVLFKVELIINNAP